VPFVFAVIGFFIFPPLGAVIGFFIGCAFSDDSNTAGKTSNSVTNSNTTYGEQTERAYNKSFSESKNTGISVNSDRLDFQVIDLYKNQKYMQISKMNLKSGKFRKLKSETKEKYLFSLFFMKEYEKFEQYYSMDTLQINPYSTISKMKEYSRYLNSGYDDVPSSLCFVQLRKWHDFSVSEKLGPSDILKLKIDKPMTSSEMYLDNIFNEVIFSKDLETFISLEEISQHNIILTQKEQSDFTVTPSTSALQSQELEDIKKKKVVIINNIDFDELDDLRENFEESMKNKAFFFIETDVDKLELFSKKELSFIEEEKLRLLEYISKVQKEFVSELDIKIIHSELIYKIYEEICLGQGFESVDERIAA
jgi:hypothetical protein